MLTQGRVRWCVRVRRTPEVRTQYVPVAAAPVLDKQHCHQVRMKAVQVQAIPRGAYPVRTWGRQHCYWINSTAAKLG
jgi:hypothetical protein